jgi:hypothetical protein
VFVLVIRKWKMSYFNWKVSSSLLIKLSFFQEWAIRVFYEDVLFNKSIVRTFLNINIITFFLKIYIFSSPPPPPLPNRRALIFFMKEFRTILQGATIARRQKICTEISEAANSNHQPVLGLCLRLILTQDGTSPNKAARVGIVQSVPITVPFVTGVGGR